MAYVVGGACINCKFSDCVAVCPVDCFYQGKNMLVINPDECIDCGACEPECPTRAIFEEGDLPARESAFRDVNAVFSGAKSISEVDTAEWPQNLRDHACPWPNITEQRSPFPGAEEAMKEDPRPLSAIDPAPGDD